MSNRSFVDVLKGTPARRLPCIVAILLVVVSLHAAAPQPAIDYSHAGYAGGGVPLPEVPVRAEVSPSGRDRDDTATIQAAIDGMSARPLDEAGWRGAVLLRSGTYRVSGQLALRASGVVLRGEPGTIVRATGDDRRALIVIEGRDDRRETTPVRITADAPAGARTLAIETPATFSLGSRVRVLRPSTREWIQALGAETFPGAFNEQRLNWLPGTRDLVWDRTVVAVDAAAGTITLDAPITAALEGRFGSGTVAPYRWPGRIENVGVEKLRIVSEHRSGAENPAGDEEHAWFGVTLDHVENAWVREVTARHFVSAAVAVGSGARAITIGDCRSESPVAERAGWRRLDFWVNGQQVLVERCTAEESWHPFAVGHAAPGPNVFLECRATAPLAHGGPFESWAAGVLYDNVHIDGAPLILGRVPVEPHGAAWNAVHSTAWNCTAASVEVSDPPTAANLAVTSAETPSLYRAQLTAREPVGRALAAGPLASHTPVGEGERRPPDAAVAAPKTFGIDNGYLIADGRVIFGTGASNAWWKGQMVPARAAQLGFSPTRWAPGRSGRGLTEDLEELATHLAERNAAIVQVWPGLWYDRRRDDHTRESRPDAFVEAPFYEMPWARSGRHQAADGLSKYDLTRFNPWYFARLRAFTRACAARGIVVVNHFYNTHNLLETGAHWVDFPWRPVNCLQDTGLPEPAFDADGRSVHIANTFFDVSHAGRRELHRRYIRHVLDVLAGESNVVHTVAFQYAGPVAFQRFFIDTVAAWERETGHTARLALVTSKEQTDAILADAAYATHIDAIDLTYWRYLEDGSLFDPPSGRDRAFREIRAERFGKDAVPPTTPAQLYRQVREYRDRFPAKALLVPHAGADAATILMAGGATPLVGDMAVAALVDPAHGDAAVIQFVNTYLGAALPRLRPDDALAAGAWALSDGERQHLIYSKAGPTLTLRDPAIGAGSIGLWFNPRTGATEAAAPVSAAMVAKPDSGPWMLLLSRVASPFTLEREEQKLRREFPDVARADDSLPPGITAREEVAYTRQGQLDLRLDVYRPAGRERLPAVLVVHGGGWETGDRRMERAFAKQLAARGYVTVTPSYRLGPPGQFPAALHDVKAAVRWLRAHAGELAIDRSRIGAVGGSAGGHLVALLGASNGVAALEGGGGHPSESSAVQAVVDIDGAADFTDPRFIAEEIEKRWGATTRFLGGAYSRRGDVWAQASPATHVSAKSAPVLFLNSARPPSKFWQREEMSGRLRRLGIDSAVVNMRGTPHAFWLFQPWFEPTLEQTEAFLRKHLKQE
ncbi:MAG TPA: DUF6298 domain-containing protein [Opitutaceae bacterium]